MCLQIVQLMSMCMRNNMSSATKNVRASNLHVLFIITDMKKRAGKVEHYHRRRQITNGFDVSYMASD